ncbi:MAG TPA: phosphatase PAP2 family protein [Thermoguttaceae bacterium]|nr:phosphatase PAP2 family protein [Thermoguttaceae bacterium]
MPEPAFPNLFTHDEDSFLTPPSHCPLGITLPLQSEALSPAGEEALDVVGENYLSLDDIPPDGDESLLLRIGHDHLNYYSTRSVLLLGAGFGAASLMAHTSLDEDVYAEVHWSVWHGGHRDWRERLRPTKCLGDGRFALPVFAGAWLAGELLEEAPFADVVGDWGERSLRTVLVGGPPMLLMQRATGASRPGESDSGSQWRPFQDSNGVSGHAFVGAVPFLCAAKMTDEMPFKAAFYAASLLPGVQRIMGEKHYLSQAFLGWTMAYVAATAVDRTEHADRNVSVLPLIGDDEVGAAVEYRW